MNNAIGLLIAVSLAMIAGVLNWNYLETKSKEIEMVSFGIAVTKIGDRYEPNAERLLQRVNSAGFRKAGVLLHPKAK